MAKKKKEAEEVAPPSPVAESAAASEAGAGGESANYTVLARRYRPQQFAELIGQDSISHALANAIKTNRVAHAYLFTGARGVGKTTAARILAKCLNCVTGPTTTPCDVCDICRAIGTGEDIDVQEIDGASNRGIDEIRAIRQNVQTRPSRGLYKIYIIDEVHMLTVPAFNALLKTLEEPPAHVKFIFATTEVQKIPITILSRCQRFDFGTITTAKITQRLKEVVASEHMEAEPEALQILARRAAGSMRDAQSLLDQLLSSIQDGKLTAGQVHELLGSAGEERILPLVEGIFAKKPSEALKTLAGFAEEGTLLGELLDQLIEFWRNLMIAQCGGMEAIGDYLPDRTRAVLERQAKAVPLDAILAGLDVLTTAKTRLRATNYPQLTLEMAVVRLCRLDELIPIGQLVQMLAGGEVPPRPPSANGPVPIPMPAAQQIKGPAAIATTNGKAVPLDIEVAWKGILHDTMLMRQMNMARRTFDRAARRIDLLFPSTAASNYANCKEPAQVEKVERELEAATKEKWSLRLGVEAAPAGSADEVRPPSPSMNRQAREEKLKEIPLTRRIIDTLGARIITIDDGFGQDTPAPADIPTEEMG